MASGAFVLLFIFRFATKMLIGGDGKNHLDNSKSIIAMVVVCLLVVFVFVALAVYFIRVHRRQRHEPKDEEKTPATTEKAKGPAPLSERVQALAVTSADVVAPFNVPQYSSGE